MKMCLKCEDRYHDHVDFCPKCNIYIGTGEKFKVDKDIDLDRLFELYQKTTKMIFGIRISLGIFIFVLIISSFASSSPIVSFMMVVSILSFFMLQVILKETCGDMLRVMREEPLMFMGNSLFSSSEVRRKAKDLLDVVGKIKGMKTFAKRAKPRYEKMKVIVLEILCGDYVAYTPNICSTCRFKYQYEEPKFKALGIPVATCPRCGTLKLRSNVSEWEVMTDYEKAQYKSLVWKRALFGSVIPTGFIFGIIAETVKTPRAILFLLWIFVASNCFFKLRNICEQYFTEKIHKSIDRTKNLRYLAFLREIIHKDRYKKEVGKDKFCPNCHKTFDESLKVCLYCSSRLVDNDIYKH